MAEFSIKTSPAASRDLDGLPDQDANRIIKSLPILEENPFPRGNVIKKIKGEKSTFFRLRVNEFRIFFYIEGTVVAIFKIVAKKDA